MIKCPECETYEPAGTIYCSECGAFLLEKEQRLSGEQLPFTDELAPVGSPLLLGQNVNPVFGTQEITFVIPSSGRRVVLELDEQILIGRADSDSGHQPALDLTVDEGIAHGVSRSHALIEASREGIVLIDKDSTNGTYLNDYRLPPELPYPLHSGDELKFGRLLVHVFLE